VEVLILFLGDDGMDVFEAIVKRRSVRSYEATPVSKEILERVLEAARVAPSASNRQPWHFIVVTDREKRKELSKGLYAKFLAEAPVVIVACGNERVSPHWYLVDVSLALQNMVIVATSEGLGTCYVGSFDEKVVKKLLMIPDDLRVIVLLAVGYPSAKEGRGRKSREAKSLAEIISHEEYDQHQRESEQT
jgi:nitroreductase